jgi:purine catabolism regulator
MPVTLGDLIDDPRFPLVRLTTPDPVADGRPIAWVHSSDLVDPTPFLDEGHVLLTDGGQLGADGDADHYEGYVSRLVARGVLGLGFATDVLHERVPELLVAACERQGLPLFDVAARTPFIALIRTVADAIARERVSRLEWSVRAQRAIARAALRPDALRGIVGEVERQLRCWAVLFDARGERIRIPGGSTIPSAAASAVAEAVREALTRGRRAADTVEIAGDRVMVQTLGRGGDLRGVFVLGGIGRLDPPGIDVVTSVVALASLALEQNRALDVARRQLRSSVLELLESGRGQAAARIAGPLWGRLPREPFRVVTADPERQLSPLLESLEALSSERRGVFFAVREDRVVILTDEDPAPVADVLAGFGCAAGIAVPATFARLAVAVEEAERARRHAARMGLAVAAFEDLMSQGVLGSLRRADAEPLARALVDRLAAHDRREGSELLPTVRTWFEENCAWIPTARRLGIHRHSLRNRIDAAGRLLRLDLDLIRDRLELWAALELGDGGSTAVDYGGAGSEAGGSEVSRSGGTPG